MYDERGIWIDDATGVPDIMMPPNMVQPNTAGYHPRPAAVPQDITPTPMMTRPTPGAPQFGGAPTPMSPEMRMLTNPQEAGIRPEPISPELTPGMVTGEWNKLTPPEAQNPFLTALKAPITAPLGIMEEIMGLFGKPTIEGWAQQAEARYGDPNFTESRAFGVPVAKEPAFGDRFTGLVTGRSQQRAMAGKLLRAEVGRYNKQRQGEIQNFKYVGDIYGQAQTLEENEMKLGWMPEDHRRKILKDQAALRSSNASATVNEMRAQKMRDDQATVRAIAEALSADPTLADGKHNSALMSLAKGNLNLVKQALEINAAGINMPDPATGLPLGERTKAQLGPVPAIAEAYGADEIRRAQAEADAAKLEAANARADAEKTTARQQQLADASTTLEQALAKEARGRVEDLYKPRLATITNDWFKDNRQAKIDEMNQEKARVVALLETGELPRNDAYAIASGDLSALATPIDQPTAAPTIAPSPTPTPSPSPTRESPAQIRERVLEEKTAEILGGGARPTPMATPTRSVAGPAMSEDARRENGQKLSRFTTRFQAEWQRTHPDKPMRGPLYEAEFKRNAEKNGLVVESLQ